MGRRRCFESYQVTFQLPKCKLEKRIAVAGPRGPLQRRPVYSRRLEGTYVVYAMATGACVLVRAPLSLFAVVMYMRAQRYHCHPEPYTMLCT